MRTLEPFIPSQSVPVFSEAIDLQLDYYKQLKAALQLTYQYLTDLANNDDSFHQVTNDAFGTSIDSDTLKAIQSQWSKSSYRMLPEVHVLEKTLGDTLGGYSKEKNTIYLSREFLTRPATTAEEISAVLLEEVGHFLDAGLNRTDTPGDEGAIFSALVMGTQLKPEQLEQIGKEVDTRTVAISNEFVVLEQALPGDPTEPGNPFPKKPGNPPSYLEDPIVGTVQWSHTTNDNNASLSRPALREVILRFDQDDRTIRTEEDGTYEFQTEGRDIEVGYLDPLPIEVILQGENKFNEGSFSVKAAGNSDPLAYIQFFEEADVQVDEESGNIPIDLTFSDASVLEGGFSIYDALYTANKVYESTYLDEGFLLSSPIRNIEAFAHTSSDGEPSSASVSISSGFTDATLNIKPYSLYSWDTILHEYGHIIATSHNWTRTIGIGENGHDFNVSNIVGGQSGPHVIAGQGKVGGANLAWREAIASYLSGAIQEIAKDNGWLPDLGNGQTIDGIIDDKMGTVSIEALDEMRGEGEGDELPIVRILWDLADSNADSFESGLSDSIAIGHEEMHNTLQQVKETRLNQGLPRPMSQLDDLWDYLHETSNDRRRADIGAIFEEYGVAPSFSDQWIQQADAIRSFTTTAPTFEWNRGNEVRRANPQSGGRKVLVEGNDLFEIIVFNEDFSQRVIDTAVDDTIAPIRDLSWTPTAEQWNQLDNNSLYHVVVVGTDDHEGINGSAYGGTTTRYHTTGDYWSGARRFAKGEVDGLINISSVKQGVSAFDTLQSGLQSSDLFAALPLIGELNESNQSLDFLIEVKDAITSELSSLPNLVSAVDLKLAFTDVLANTLDILSEEIEVVEEADGSTRFDFEIGSSLSLDSQSLAADLGLPNLGFNLSNRGSLDLDLGYDLKFSLDINEDGTYAFLTPDDEDINLQLQATLSDNQLNGKFGFLQVEASTDDHLTSGFQLDLGIDIDGLAVQSVDIGGAADLNLDLKTSFADSETLPSLLTDFALSWDFTNGTPNVAFNDVRVDVGSFFNQFARPILDNVQDFTRPIEPFLNFLNTDIDLAVVDFQMRDIINFALDNNDRAFLDSVLDVVELANSIDTSNTNLELRLGSFNLGTADITDDNFQLSNASANVTDTYSFSQQIGGITDTQERNFLADVASAGSSIAFPLLTDQAQAFNLLLGKDADLFTYDLPELRFSGGYQSPFIPIIGPLGARFGGNVSATANLDFGFDTFGLRQVAEGAHSSNVFDGFYIGEGSGLEFSAGITAAAELNALVVAAGLEANITGTADLDLQAAHNHDNDPAKIRIDEISLTNPFDLSGRVTAGLDAYVRVGVWPFRRTFWVHGPQYTVIDFGGGSTKTAGYQSIVVNEIADAQTGSTTVAYERLGTDSSDHISGSSIHDLFIGGAGADNLIGGEGFDVSSYITADAGITIDLTSGVKTGDARGDTFDSIEQIIGTKFDDRLYGSSGNDVLDGADGDDTIEGRAGDDVISGGVGANNIDGGSGNDSLSYLTSTEIGATINEEGQQINNKGIVITEGVTVNLANGTAFGGHADNDRITGIENVEGSAYNDTLTGDRYSNVLSGLTGNDVLLGGAGLDTLTGGEGRDRFVIDGGGMDTITDLDLARDNIWVKGVTYFSDLKFVQSGKDTLMILIEEAETLAKFKGIEHTSIGEENFSNDFAYKSSPAKPFPVPGKFPGLDL